MVQLLLNWAEGYGQTPQAAAMLAEAGHVATTSPNDAASAESLFQRALACDPHCVRAVAGLQQLLTEQGRFTDAAVFLSEHIRQLQNLAQPGSQPFLSDLYVNLAFILRDQLADPEGAATCLERALHLDPSNRQAVLAQSAAPTPEPANSQANTVGSRANVIGPQASTAGHEGSGADHEGSAAGHEGNATGHEGNATGLEGNPVAFEGNPAAPPQPEVVGSAPDTADPPQQPDIGEKSSSGYVAVPEPAADDDSLAAQFARRAATEADGGDDLDGAIDTLREALREVPGDVHIMHQLAAYLTRRAERADERAASLDLRRAAELFYQIGLGISGDDPKSAVAYVESALTAEPGHDNALDLLEQLSVDLGQEPRLPPFWVAYLARTGPGPEADRRRLALGRAYAQAGQIDDAIFCLEQLPHNHAEASAILSALLAQRSDLDHGTERDAGPRIPPARGPRRPTPSEMRRADDAARVAELRKEFHHLIAENRQGEAADRCRDIVAIDHCDPEAFHFLESHLRRARDYRGLRDLLVASTRTPGVPVDTRRSRLLEVASLSERKLDDLATAVAALQGVVTLSSTEGEAARHLKALLKQTERWDDLVSLLERETLSATDPESKASMLAELADVHEFHRGDQAECAAALKQLHELRPGDDAVRDRLCTLLLAQGRYAEALPILERRLQTADGDRDRASRLRVLIEVSTDLKDDDRTYRYCEQLIAAAGDDSETLSTMARIDEARGDFAALAEVLRRKAQLLAGGARADLLMRVGRLCGDELGDLDRAAEAYTKAIEADAEHLGALHALITLFETAGRHEELSALLDKQVERDQASAVRAECLRELARVRAERLQDRTAAASAYRQLIAIEEDLIGLDFLGAEARELGDNIEAARYLYRAQMLVPDKAERRQRLLDLAELEQETNGRPRQAMASLSLLLSEVVPSDGEAASLLYDLGTAEQDNDALSLALTTLVKTEQDRERALSYAQELADRGERDEDPSQAIAGLSRWAELSPEDPEPMRRLAEQYALINDGTGQVAALAGWARIASSPDDQRRALLSAAAVSFELLGDTNAAWSYLVNYVESGDREAEARLRELCHQQKWTDRLINLHMTVIRRPDTPPGEQVRRWLLIADLFQHDLNSIDQAIEAAVRAVAADWNQPQALDRLDALCLRCNASARLSQVYDRLIRKATDESERRRLLQRHAELIERGLGSLEEAFERVAAAYHIEPDNESIVQQLERLASASGQGRALLMLYAQQADAHEEPVERVHLYLRCADFSDRQLMDHDVSHQYLRQALAATEQDVELCRQIWELAVALDRRRSADAADARQALGQSHLQLSAEAEPDRGRFLVLSASQIQDEVLHDTKSALDTLFAGVGLWPTDDVIYERCFALAQSQDALHALDRHLEAQAREAADAEGTAALLQRRGALLEGPLERPEDAALVFDKLLQLRPDNVAIAEGLRTSLREAGRYQELLLAINKQLTRAKQKPDRLALLKEAAETWEHGLGNRYEALEAWRRVLNASADDEQAAQAIRRLAPKSMAPQLDGWFKEAQARQAAAALAEAQAQAEAEAQAQAEAQDLTSLEAEAYGDLDALAEAAAMEPWSADTDDDPTDDDPTDDDPTDDGQLPEVQAGHIGSMAARDSHPPRSDETATYSLHRERNGSSSAGGIATEHEPAPAPVARRSPRPDQTEIGIPMAPVEQPAPASPQMRTQDDGIEAAAPVSRSPLEGSPPYLGGLSALEDELDRRSSPESSPQPWYLEAVDLPEPDSADLALDAIAEDTPEAVAKDADHNDGDFELDTLEVSDLEELIDRGTEPQAANDVVAAGVRPRAPSAPPVMRPTTSIPPPIPKRQPDH